MRTASPGNRLIVGSSGVIFETAAAVASGLVNAGEADYADGDVADIVAAAPEPAEDMVAGTEVDLEELTVRDLRKLAAEQHVDLGDVTRKAEIVDLIAAALG